MEHKSIFTHTEPELLRVLDQLIAREPIFHTPEFGESLQDYERVTAPDYWEVGASERRYSREFILEHLAGQRPAFASEMN